MTAVLAAYLLLCWAAGVGLTFVSRMPWQLEGRLAAGLPLGFGAAAMLTWLAAIPAGMSGVTVAAGALATAATLAACLTWTPWRARLLPELAGARDRCRRYEPLPLLLLLALAGLFFVPFYGHAMSRLPDGLYAGYVNIWGDWSTHLSLAGYLSQARHVLPPQNPFFAGTNLTYSFLPDLFSGGLTHMGMSLPGSLSLVSAILSVALVVIFYSFALRLTGSRWAAAAATLLLFLSGGTGFATALGDIHPTGPGLLGWLGGAVNLVAAPPHEYTLDRNVGFQWLNPVLAYLVPQRTTLFGWPLGMIGLAVLWYGWTTRSRREMAIAGVLVGLLPLFHIATYLDLGVIAGGLFLLSLRPLRRGPRPGRGAAGVAPRAAAPSAQPVARAAEPLPHAGPGALAVAPALGAPGVTWRAALLNQYGGWLAFVALAAVLGLPQAWLIVPKAAIAHSFPRLEVGWLAVTDQYHLFWPWFWIMNTALLIPLALIAFAFGGGKPRLRRFLAPAWLLFAIANVVVLAPWDWDNTKYFIWWAIPMCVMAGVALVRIGRRGVAWTALAAVMLLVCTASAALDLDRAAQARLNQPGLRFLDNDELATASWAETTPAEAVYLTGWQHNHPILTMSRHVEVMGYPGWLWSWGINYCQRQADVVAMYGGGAGTPGLLKRYGVSYVVIGPEERGREVTCYAGLDGPAANAAYFAANYPVAYRSPAGEYLVYRVG
ncbi:MAG TPA: hypothetical protein VG245_06270 [Candidatus Dormibacteraeota bacterium]|jgi:hypothetical protein|nr:hypothetical protein [Candidatus Dormibacteraeota bacterium]